MLLIPCIYSIYGIPSLNCLLSPNRTARGKDRGRIGTGKRDIMNGDTLIPYSGGVNNLHKSWYTTLKMNTGLCRRAALDLIGFDLVTNEHLELMRICKIAQLTYQKRSCDLVGRFFLVKGATSFLVGYATDD